MVKESILQREGNNLVARLTIVDRLNNGIAGLTVQGTFYRESDSEWWNTGTNDFDLASEPSGATISHVQDGLYELTLTNGASKGQENYRVHIVVSGDLSMDFAVSQSIDNLMELEDDAIKKAKFDESTAFPLENVDAGDTLVARKGADSDTLETLSDQLDIIEGMVQDVQNNTRVAVGCASAFSIPESGFRVYKITLTFKDSEGNMEDPDDNEFSFYLETADSAIDKTGILYKDLSVSVSLDASVKFSGYKALERVSVGRYFCYVKVADTEDPVQLMHDYACEENSVAAHYPRSNLLTLKSSDFVTLGDTDSNKLVIAKAFKDQDVSGTSAVSGSNMLTLISSLESSIPTALLSKVIDGMTLQHIFELVAAMVDGRILKDSPETGDLTFFKRDNTTILTIARTTASERTRL